MIVPAVDNSSPPIGLGISNDSHIHSTDSHQGTASYWTMKMVPSIISYIRCTDHGLCADLHVYTVSRPEYTRQSPDCPLVIFSFIALPPCITALYHTALPLPSIALSLILIFLLIAHTCTLIASILQECHLQTPCPCFKCDHCLK